MTSILRTYYTFKIVQSSDTSYNIIVMGLWTWAEITSGILVSCLPIMPKFFQHMTPKLKGTFASISRFGFKSGSADTGAGTTGSTSLRKSFNRHKNPRSSSDVLNDPHGHEARPKGDYITLTENDAENKSHHERLSGLREMPAPKRQDLESGR